MNILVLINMVISTLGDIEVKGKTNLKYLLGSIETLEGIAKSIQSETPGHKEEVSEDEKAKIQEVDNG